MEKGLESAKLLGLPSDAEPVSGFNATDITTNTAVAIIAGVAGKRIYVSKLIIHNKTPAEEADITVQDDEATPVKIASTLVSTAAGNGGTHVIDFMPPVPITTGADLDGIAAGALGDTIIHASGWIGTPGA